MWHRPKDQNYYNRLALVSKVKRIVETKLKMFEHIDFNPPIPYSYGGGKKSMESIERYQYESCFKRIFSVIRLKLSDGSYVKLPELRTKHLTKIYQYLNKST